jgi:hypothetical protein
MFRKADKDVISQAELRKGAEWMTGTSSAVLEARSYQRLVKGL